jgi:hypothetical protein
MTEMKATYFSYSRCNPNIHLISINGVQPQEENFEEFLRFSDRSAKELEGAMIVDLSNRKYLSIAHRVKVAKLISSNSEHIAKNWTSIALVNTSFFSVLSLMVSLWLKPMPTRAKAFKSFDEAVTWSYKMYLCGEN